MVKFESKKTVIIFYVLAPLPLVIARNMESESGLEMGGKSEYAKNGFFDEIFLQSLLLNWLHHLIIRLARRPRKPRCHRGI